MNRTQLILLYLILITISDCTYKNKEILKEGNELTEIKIDELPQPSELKLSELKVSDVKYIPLETGKYCLLPDIDDNMSKLAVNDSGIFIEDWVNGEKIIRFNKDGKFVCSIGVQGKGPGEYLFINDLSIDFENNRIAILSLLQDKILLFNMHGEYISTLSCPKNTTHIVCVKGNILCYNRNTGSIENSFELLNSKGNTIRTYPNKYRFKAGDIVFVKVENELLHYWHNNELNIKERYCDTVFAFRDTVFQPRIILNRVEKRYNTDLMIYNTEEELINTIKKVLPNYIEEFNLFEMGDFEYSEFRFNDSSLIYVVSKNQNYGLLKILDNGITNDFDGGPNLYCKAMKNDSTFIYWMSAVDLITYMNSEEFKTSTPLHPEKKQQLQDMVKNIKENDNPVVIEVTLNMQ